MYVNTKNKFYYFLVNNCHKICNVRKIMHYFYHKKSSQKI